MTLFLRIIIFNIRGPRPTYLWPRLKHFASAEASQKMGYECKVLLNLTSGQEVILARRTRPSKMEVSPWSLGLSKYIVYFHLKLPLDLRALGNYQILLDHKTPCTFIWNNFGTMTYLDHQRPHLYLITLLYYRRLGDHQSPYFNWKLPISIYEVRFENITTSP